MRSTRIISGVASAALIVILAGCAALPMDEDDPRAGKVYRTGSNLPQRHPDPSVVDVDPSAIQSGINRRGGVPRTMGGGG